VIDYFSLALIHGLLVLTALRLLARDDLDEDASLEEISAPLPPQETAVERRAREKAAR
jgi:hypothetical protein